jgi:hypothetical protein
VVTFGERLVRLAAGEGRIMLEHRFPLAENEVGLEVERLLTPERSVVVERRNAIRLRHERGAGFRRTADEIQDRFANRAGPPTFQRGR